MDPLTIALAAVTLATMIKDIVELVQQIRESASQISRNDEDSLKLSEDIVRTMHRIQEFCDNNPNTLENVTELKTALIDMKSEMQRTHEKICEMLPSRIKNKLFIRMWLKTQAWRRQSQVKENIRELRDRVNQCHIDFMKKTSAVMRIEGRVHRSSSENMIIVQMPSMHHGDVQHPGHTLKQGALIHPRMSDQQLASFIGSRPAIHPSTSLELSGDLISDQYICFQLQRVGKLLVDLPTIQFAGVENPSERYFSPFIVNGSLGIWEHSVARDNVVIETHQIHYIIQAGFTTLTVQDAAWEMGQLSTHLHDLGMHSEATMTGHWSVQLLRILARANHEVYTPHLIQAFLSLSYSYLCMMDLNAAQSVISESYTCIQPLISNYPSNQEFTMLYCRILTALGELASHQGDKARALRFFEEALHKFEILLQPYIVDDVHRPPDTSWSKERIHLALRDYSRTLCNLANTFQALHRFVDAAISAKNVVLILQITMAAYPGCYMQVELACTLYQLSDPDFRSTIPLENAHMYAKKSAVLYRKLYNQDPQAYEIRLFYVLWRLASILQQMDRRDEALLIRREMADLARRITHDQTLLAKALDVVSRDLLLSRRDDEVITLCLESFKTYRSVYKTISIQEADGHHNLSVALQRRGHLENALLEAEEAVAQYRALASDNPNPYLSHLARGLGQLSNILDNAGNYSRAFSEGHEALKQYESIIRSRPDVLKDYMRCLATNMRITHNLRHPVKSVEQGKDIIWQFSRLAVQYPVEVGLKLAQAIRTYSSLLDDLDMVSESFDWCKRSLELYKGFPTPKNSDSFEGHMNCLVDYHICLWSQGHFSGALEPLGQAIKIGDELVSKHPSLIPNLIDLKLRRAHPLCDLGHYSKALEDINAATTLCRKMTPGPSNVKMLIRCLITSSQVHRSNRNPDAAIDAARKAVKLCCGQSIKRHVWAIQELAEGLMDNDMEREAQEAMEGLEFLDPSWRSSVEAVWRHSVHLFAIGKLPDNADLLKVKQYYAQRTEKRPGYVPEFTKILWTLGVFYCSQGRHEEGQATAIELKQFMVELQEHSEVAALAEITLEYERNRPSWKAIFTKLDLSCRHQDG